MWCRPVAYIYDLTAKPVTPRIVEFPGTGDLKFARYTADGRMIETLRTDFGTMSSSFQLWDPVTFAPIDRASSRYRGSRSHRAES